MKTSSFDKLFWILPHCASVSWVDSKGWKPSNATRNANCGKTTPNEEKKVLYHQDNVPCHKLIATMAKLHKLNFYLRPHPPYFPDLTPSDYYLFEDLKRMLQGKRLGFNEKVIAESEAYFQAKNKSSYNKGIEMLEKRWNEYITLEGEYVDEWSRILPKSCCFISHPMKKNKKSVEKVLFHHENAPAHTGAIATAKLFDLLYEILPSSTLLPRFVSFRLFFVYWHENLAWR